MMRAAGYIAAILAAAFGSSVSAQGNPDIAGTWSQSSRGKELVLVPKIKLQPNVGVGPGTSLGGTTGYGSLTRTAIVTEPTLIDVARSMTLTVAADGRFSWTIVKRHAEDARCTRTTTQEKKGRVTRTNGMLVFAISGGSERWQSSCGKSGNGAISPASESYDLSVQGGMLQLASGPVRWTFKRG